MLDWLRRAVLGCILLFAGAVALSYIGDYLVLRYRVSTRKEPFGEVTLTPYFAIPLKNGKTEYDFQPPQSQACANSLYPHFGMEPCWYLRRHPEKRIEI